MVKSPSRRGQGTNYDDKFEDVMHYVTMNLEKNGRRVKIRDKNDLRLLIEKLDKHRQDQKGQERISDKFLHKILDSRAAQAKIGRVLGRFGKVGVLKTRREENQTLVKQYHIPSERLRAYRDEGTELYRYKEGVAAKIYTTTKRGTKVYKFRDINTGRFIKKNTALQDFEG